MNPIVENYLAERSLRHEATHGVVIFHLSLSHSVALRVTIATALPGGGIGTAASPMSRVPREIWQTAVWACNSWNGGHPLMRARLHSDDWAADATATFILDARLPSPADRDESAVTKFLDAAIREATTFCDRLTGHWVEPAPERPAEASDGPYRL